MAIEQPGSAGRGAKTPAAETSNTAARAPLRRHLMPASDGSRYRQLTLALGVQGELSLTAHEMGASPDAAWGADDHEVSLSLAPDVAARLAFVLLAEELSGQRDGFERLLALCERHGLDHRLASWT